MTSNELWIPLIWLLIIASRPVSFWFGGGVIIENPEDYLQGSPTDRLVYLLLLFLSFVILFRRKIDWTAIYASNRWLFIFFVYWFLSIIWSEYPIVGLKRWVKDVGNVLMIMIILTDKEPVKATRAILARFTNLLVPLSVILIKYYADLGRYFDKNTWEHLYRGIAIEKNSLGMLSFLSGVFLVWDFIEMRVDPTKKTDKADMIFRVALLCMVIWLLNKSNSMTSIISLILGGGIIYYMRLPFVKKQIKHLGSYTVVFCILIIVLYSIPEILKTILGIFGRDITLTGRTELWAQLFNEPINPIIGTGYQSFWLGSRLDHYWELWNFRPNQAHNGYLDTYLNGGWIGVFMLMAMIISTGRSLKKKLLLGKGYEILCFSFFVVTVTFNFTEAYFNRMCPIWFVFLLAALNYPRTSGFTHDEKTHDNMA